MMMNISSRRVEHLLWRALAVLLPAGVWLAGCTGLSSHDQTVALKEQLAVEQAQRENLAAQYDQLKGGHQALEKQQEVLSRDFRDLKQEYHTVTVKYRELEQSHKQLTAEYQQLETQYRTTKTRNQKLEAVASQQAASTRNLEEDLARYKLLALDKEHQAQVLSKKLDEAILEVVRTMAKLRSLESKAEAASNLAEAEIALDLLRRGLANRDGKLDVKQAEDLLELSAKEFKKQNYGGVVYLTTQAKSLIKGQQTRSQERENMTEVEGETVFSLPLPLRTVAKSNIREAPAAESKVLFALEEHTPVIGQSFKGAWVRITSEDGKLGWIFFDLIDRR